MSEIHFRSHFWPFQIDRPFWISEIHFRSQFWPYFFSGGHFGCLDRISGHFRLIGHFGCPKFTFDGISGHFRYIQNFIYFIKFLTKWMGRQCQLSNSSEIFGGVMHVSSLKNIVQILQTLSRCRYNHRYFCFHLNNT